ncbi:MAG: hypothetical protein KGR48_11745 [Alphaproteobacteria bacterium]|nr:hypothetical protein [Alphaproteobacteria bacterium]MBU6472710.1 hypothetical protein [Alphaproteobacteria bacterium]MDE2013430.1 hypothetical protein [Alphaproteobacteria bacterium]MDE2073281.1 hypothetical protein [Alphaproteobacteria bacterium]MDE2351211.1 hypothetical protein [Alphaproteobacteria bacterium]
MDRRYYLLKVSLTLVGILTVCVTGSMGSTHLVHLANLARYSAPARVEATAWQTTAGAVRAAARLLDSVRTAL